MEGRTGGKSEGREEGRGGDLLLRQREGMGERKWKGRVSPKNQLYPWMRPFVILIIRRVVCGMRVSVDWAHG